MLTFIMSYWWLWLVIAAVSGTVSYLHYKKKKREEEEGVKAQFILAGLSLVTVIILICNLIGIIAAILGIISFVLGLVRWFAGF